MADGIELVNITSINDVRPGGQHHENFAVIHKMGRDIFGPKDFVPPEYFERLLRLNDDPSMQSRWGPAQYVLTFARDAESGQAIAAIAYLIMALPEDLRDKHNYDATIANEYTYSGKNIRGGGIGQMLLKEREAQIRRFLSEVPGAEAGRFLVFHEIADPFESTAREYQEKKQASDTYQHDGALFWHKRGLRSLGIPIVTESVAKSTLRYTLYVLNEGPVASDLMYHHARVSGAICDYGGEDPVNDVKFQDMGRIIFSRTRHTPVNLQLTLEAMDPHVKAIMADPHTALDLPMRDLIEARDPAFRILNA